MHVIARKDLKTNRIVYFSLEAKTFMEEQILGAMLDGLVRGSSIDVEDGGTFRCEPMEMSEMPTFIMKEIPPEDVCECECDECDECASHLKSSLGTEVTITPYDPDNDEEEVKVFDKITAPTFEEFWEKFNEQTQSLNGTETVEQWVTHLENQLVANPEKRKVFNKHFGIKDGK